MNNNYLKIKALITNNIHNFSGKQKKIANYIIENPKKFALQSIRELEEELGISKATIVRMAQTLGYSGLLEMKRDAKEYLSNSLEPLEKYEEILTTAKEQNNFLDILGNEVILNIKKTQELISDEQFNRFINFIEKAKEVHTVGQGISMYLAEIANYLLNRVSIKSFAFSGGGAPFPEKLINFDETDLLLAFYFPSYSKEVKETVQYAREKGLKVLVITDKVTNELVNIADEYLLVSVESCTVSNSISSVITLLYAIIGKIGQDNKDKTLESLKSVKKIREEYK